jgi:hypothetical protein
LHIKNGKYPTIVDFAGKMSKATLEKAKQVEQLVEALACSIEQLKVIKFWAINSQTMEVYTFWWNGRFVKSFGILIPRSQRLWRINLFSTCPI